MLNIHQRYCKETFFNGELDRFETVCPPDFNFAYDVVDEIAKAEPQRRAMLWCNTRGEEKTFSFSDFQKYKMCIRDRNKPCEKQRIFKDFGDFLFFSLFFLEISRLMKKF